jgi:hypothetical protein
MVESAGGLADARYFMTVIKRYGTDVKQCGELARFFRVFVVEVMSY